MSDAASGPRSPHWRERAIRAIAPRTLGRYLLVGGGSALVEFVLFNLLFGIAGLPLIAANLASIGVVIALGFVSHKHFTFRSPGGYGRQLRWYLFMLGVSVSLNNLLLWIFVQKWEWSAPLAKVIQIGLCFLWNYSFSRRVVFARPPAA